MPVAKVQITGGHFQDFEGNALNAGYLIFELNQDELASGVGQVCAGKTIKVTLDSTGSVALADNVFMWPNDVLVPANSYYTVTGYTSSGQLAWGPNVQQILSSPSPFNLDAWQPNVLTAWTPSLTNPTLQTDGVNNTLQSKLNLISGTGISLSADSLGGVTITNTAVPLTPVINVAGFVPGTMTNSQTLLHYEVRQGMSFPLDLTTSKCVALTAATGSTTITIKKNGVSVATMVFGVGGTTATLSGAAFTCTTNDYIDVVGPATADATLAGLSFTLVATRTS